MSSLAGCMSTGVRPRPLASRNGRARCSVNGSLPEKPDNLNITRKNFPSDFRFGTGTSAYQTEGGAKQGGKGPSIWDIFTHESPEKIADGSNGDIANNSYDLYLEDIKLMKEMGVNAYRFSISWSRILPEGNTIDGTINKEGVKYYHNLLDALKANGIEPYVTLFHFDLPQALETKYNGILSRSFVNDFKDFANVCFNEFGEKVKHWFSINEPQIYALLSYDYGTFPAGRCSPPEGECPAGDSATEPYIATHNLILAHATAVDLYRSKYQASQGGEIGISLNCNWSEPYSDSYRDHQAAERAMEFEFGWCLDPIVFGDYPFNMRALVRNRLPYFTEEEAKMVKGSFDFIGVNYYTGSYGRSRDINANDVPVSYVKDSYTDKLNEKDGVAIGPVTNADQYVYPEGIKKILMYLKNRYNDPVIYITENGLSVKEEPLTLIDIARINYLATHLYNINEAISNGVNVKGYFIWSLMDDFEWQSGYTRNVGIIAVDRQSESLERYPKLSATWFSHFLRKDELTRRPTKLPGPAKVSNPQLKSTA